MWAYGLGVDSTAGIIGDWKIGRRPDAILFADVGSEKPETYAYLPIFQQWLASVGFPPVTVVRYQVKNYKHWPPYSTIGENCLTNGTLPSLAFGFKSCSQKWKIGPQDRWTAAWPPAQESWAAGMKVRKAIGYDAGPHDTKRYIKVQDGLDPAYDYVYPLREWGWDRERCKAEILSVGLPVPPKSACYFCPSTHPEELHLLAPFQLRGIVAMEARAHPRLMAYWSQEQVDKYNAGRRARWEAAGRDGPPPKLAKVGDGCAGLWRSKTKAKPALMTEYIRSKGLLPEAEIDEIWNSTPRDLIAFQEAFAEGQHLDELSKFIKQHGLSP
jgi:hypothetical protein